MKGIQYEATVYAISCGAVPHYPTSLLDHSYPDHCPYRQSA